MFVSASWSSAIAGVSFVEANVAAIFVEGRICLRAQRYLVGSQDGTDIGLHRERQRCWIGRLPVPVNDVRHGRASVPHGIGSIFIAARDYQRDRTITTKSQTEKVELSDVSNL